MREFVAPAHFGRGANRDAILIKEKIMDASGSAAAAGPSARSSGPSQRVLGGWGNGEYRKGDVRQRVRIHHEEEQDPEPRGTLARRACAPAEMERREAMGV